MRKANVLLESVTEYLAAWKAETAGSLRTSAGDTTGDNWRMNEANSALPRNVDWKNTSSNMYSLPKKECP